MPSTATPSRPNRPAPRWYTLPVVREIPAPPVQAGSAW
jgi:hypothetical protein